MCLRACGKVVHSRWGKPGNRVKAWASAKPAVIRRRQRVTAGGWITAREQAASRGVRNPYEGNTLKGGPRNGSDTKQGRKVQVLLGNH